MCYLGYISVIGWRFVYSLVTFFFFRKIHLFSQTDVYFMGLGSSLVIAAQEAGKREMIRRKRSVHRIISRL